MQLKLQRSSRLSRLIIIILAMGIFLLPGCGTTKIEGVGLLYPKFPATVDSLQPEFRWETAPGATYDFAVWRLREKPYWTIIGACGNAWYSRGGSNYLQTIAPYYYVENLTENVHRIATPLEPANCYAWSVRLRKDNVPAKWSTISEYDWMGYQPKAYFIGRFQWFMTPRKVRPLTK
jgi:hypothetical protein